MAPTAQQSLAQLNSRGKALEQGLPALRLPAHATSSRLADWSALLLGSAPGAGIGCTKSGARRNKKCRTEEQRVTCGGTNSDARSAAQPAPPAPLRQKSRTPC
eukprot:352701-Chlamydomonas_euryale.AAC.3